MKQLITILFLFSIHFLLAQTTWNTKIDYENTESLYSQSDFIKTIDGNYLFMYWRLDNPSITGIHKFSHALSKFNVQGELLWEKYFDHSEYISSQAGLHPRSMVEMADGKIAVVGRVLKAWNGYLYVTDSNGDSLFYSSFPEYTSFRKVVRYSDHEILILAFDDDNNRFLLKVDITTGLIETNSLLPLSFPSTSFFPNGSDYFYNFSISNGTIDIKKYLHNGDIVLENSLPIPEGFDGDNGGGGLRMNTVLSNNGFSLYKRGVLVIDDNLSPTLSVPFNFSSLYVGGDLDAYENHFILPTQDNGFLLSGTLTSASTSSSDRVFFIKINSQGEEEWSKLYTAFWFPFTNVPHILEEPDGYVLIRHSIFHGEIHMTKITKNGELVFTNEVRRGQEIEMYPNPCQNVFNIRFPKEYKGSVLRIFDIGGSLVFQNKSPLSTQNQIDISSLSSGIYTIQIISPNQKMMMGKLVKIE